MEIEWAKEMAKEVNGSYEHYVNDSSKMVVRINMPKGINSFEFKKIKRKIPRKFMWVGIFYHPIKKTVYMLIMQK